MLPKEQNIFNSLWIILFGKKKGGVSLPGGSQMRMSDLEEIRTPLTGAVDKEEFYQMLRSRFPKNYKDIYRIFALETAHFTSGQFRYTNSPGMRVFGDAFPYGWTSGRQLWENDPNLAPIGYKTFKTSQGTIPYLAFKTPLAAATYLDVYLDKYSPGRWYSTKPELQQQYTKKLQTIKLPA